MMRCQQLQPSACMFRDQSKPFTDFKSRIPSYLPMKFGKPIQICACDGSRAGVSERPGMEELCGAVMYVREGERREGGEG